MKGLILCGGTGSRLYPLNLACNKQLLPVYDKPMFYYPLCVLVNFGIKDICIISDKTYIDLYHKILGNGNHLGLNIIYQLQERPEGLSQAFILTEDFIKNDDVCLILGDNILHGFSKNIYIKPPTIFAYKVKNPSSYGVVEFDNNKKVISLEEKPKRPKSQYAVPGLYFFDKNAAEYAKSLTPSKRGELEIIDLINIYLKRGDLSVEVLGKETVWLDAGTQTSLYEAASYINTIQQRQGFKIGCIEEECFNQKLITKEQFDALVKSLPNSEYKEYLLSIQ